MKSNELMLGDWVLVERYEGIYGGPVWKQAGKVNGIFQEEAEIRFSDEDDDDEFIYSYPSDGIEPIPLTPEILEKNGFAKISPQDTWLYRPLDKYGDKFLYAIRARRFDYPIYRIDIDNYVFRTGMGFSGQLQYVHELQHALRLCGIDLDIKL